MADTGLAASLKKLKRRLDLETYVGEPVPVFDQQKACMIQDLETYGNILRDFVEQLPLTDPERRTLMDCMNSESEASIALVKYEHDKKAEWYKEEILKLRRARHDAEDMAEYVKRTFHSGAHKKQRRV